MLKTKRVIQPQDIKVEYSWFSSIVCNVLMRFLIGYPYAMDDNTIAIESQGTEWILDLIVTDMLSFQIPESEYVANRMVQ